MNPVSSVVYGPFSWFSLQLHPPGPRRPTTLRSGFGLLQGRAVGPQYPAVQRGGRSLSWVLARLPNDGFRLYPGRTLTNPWTPVGWASDQPQQSGPLEFFHGRNSAASLEGSPSSVPAAPLPLRDSFYERGWSGAFGELRELSNTSGTRLGDRLWLRDRKSFSFLLDGRFISLPSYQNILMGWDLGNIPGPYSRFFSQW